MSDKSTSVAWWDSNTQPGLSYSHVCGFL